jgi:hypothetical protein
MFFPIDFAHMVPTYPQPGEEVQTFLNMEALY